jgi:caffeoyl-CoA O-methyltransferase
LGPSALNVAAASAIAQLAARLEPAHVLHRRRDAVRVQATTTAQLDAYLESINGSEPALLRELREETLLDPLSHMSVAPITAKFLSSLVGATGARKLCEVGVYTGYSSVSLAMAMPDDGRLWCFDINPLWTEVARRYWRRGGLEHKICLQLGDAAESMERLTAEGHAATFDLVFVDADKANYWRYWDLAHVLLRPQGVVVVDNTLFQDAVSPEWTDERLMQRWADVDPRTRIAWVRATHHLREFNRRARNDSRFTSVTIPVGDGVTLGVKR